MSNDIDGLQAQVNELVDAGFEYNEAIELVVAKNGTKANDMLTRKLRKRYEQDAKTEARRSNPTQQLSFDYDNVTWAIPARRVYIEHDDGRKTIKPAGLSTGEERLKSMDQTLDECRKIAARTEAERTNEERLQSQAALRGMDLTTQPFRTELHKVTGTKCWRCGLGYIEGDPFEMGHSDKPHSQGGIQVNWEHRSCNRSAKDNPVNYVQFNNSTKDGPVDYWPFDGDGINAFRGVMRFLGFGDDLIDGLGEAAA